MRNLHNKKTLITGAANGIGREIALKMATEGAELALLDKDRSGLDALKMEIQKLGGDPMIVECDLNSESEIQNAAKQILQHWGSLQILINNAGIGSYGPLHELTTEERNRVLQVNLHAPFSLFQHFLHHLLKEDESHVVNISSIFGLTPQAKTAAYATSKYGLVGFSESIRAEYHRWGLGVTLVCPGFVRTAMIEALPTTTQSGERLKAPPKWLTTTPDVVAKKVVNGIKRNKRLVLATPLGHFLYHSKRLMPGLFDLIQTFKSSSLKRWIPGWSKRKRLKNGKPNDLSETRSIKQKVASESNNSELMEPIHSRESTSTKPQEAKPSAAA